MRNDESIESGIAGNATAGRRFGKLGDQQLLDQTKRLADNKRSLEVHILDHLAEIDLRGLALRRGFSSLFEYAVRELGFSDGSAQRRIQALRLSRRHGWVREQLVSGELSLTAAAQLETSFAGVERRWRRSGGAGSGAGATSVPSGVETGGSPSEDVPERAGSRASVEDEAAPAPIAARRTGGARGDGPSPAAATTGAGVGVPDKECAGMVMAPEPSAAEQGGQRRMPVAAVVAARGPANGSLIDPRRQRELIEQAAGLSTREVDRLIAAAAPGEARPRDTLRAVTAGRYTLKVSIDEDCERGLRLLKGLLSHVDSRMSWGDLVARVVREAVERHDPRGGGRGRARRNGSGAAKGTGTGKGNSTEGGTARGTDHAKSKGKDGGNRERTGAGSAPAPERESPHAAGCDAPRRARARVPASANGKAAGSRPSATQRPVDPGRRGAASGGAGPERSGARRCATPAPDHRS